MKSGLIDTHSHLYLEEFDDDRREVVERAKRAGIVKILLPNIDASTIAALQKSVEEHSDIFLPMAGLHPTSVKEDYESELEIAENELRKGGYIAVGEIGIDLYWDKTFLKEQRQALRSQFDMALRFGLPVVIHMRDSYEEVIEICREYAGKGLRGVFHCFTGTAGQAEYITSLGFYLGIGGVVTFKNSGLAGAIENIDLEHIILETDAPYVAPVPYRGKRNESAYITLVAGKLADIYNKPAEEIAEITTRNAVNLFDLKL